MPLKSLEELLVEEGLCTEDKISELGTFQQEGRCLVQVLLDNNVLQVDQLAKILWEHFGIRYDELFELEIDQRAVDLLTHEAAEGYGAVPLRFQNEGLVVAMTDPLNIEAAEDIYVMTGYRVLPSLAREKDILVMISRLYGAAQINTIQSQFVVEEHIRQNHIRIEPGERSVFEMGPVGRLVDSMINSAILHRASDIHIEIYEDSLRTRFRIDGRLRDFQTLDGSMLPNIISRLKIMGGMDIGERRLPQDGHYRQGGIDLRFSTIPTLYGEKAVIRLIYNDGQKIDVNSLGFFPEDLKNIQKLLENPYGAVIVTGPTGSGKTTTLAGFLHLLNRPDVNIVTMEDPVEYSIYGVNHININPAIGLTFENILRFVLRQDPDIIMVGEIRDAETAKMAAQAAIAGRLVLSTLHTNDAVSTVIRLTNIGIAHYVVAAALKAVISQRLVRRLCGHCKRKHTPSPYERSLLQLDGGVLLYEAGGCPQCEGTGYSGRLMVYEYMAVTPQVAERIEQKDSYDQLKQYMRQSGMRTIWENTRRHLLVGHTSFSEMRRVAFVDNENSPK